MFFQTPEQDKKIKYELLLPERPYEGSASTVRLIGCDKAGEDDATWKELVLIKEWRCLHVFNLDSHGRRMFRVQARGAHVFSLSRTFLVRLRPHQSSLFLPLFFARALRSRRQV